MPRPSSTTTSQDSGSFAAFLATTRPKTVEELADELRKLVGKIRDTGKAGSITLTLKISPVDGDTNVLSVNDEIKVRAPEHTRQGSLAFPDAVNNLSRHDPNTMPLFDEDLRTPEPEYDPRTGEIKEAPNA